MRSRESFVHPRLAVLGPFLESPGNFLDLTPKTKIKI